MISFEQKGDFKKLSRYFERLREVTKLGVLDKYGREGVAALASATPVKTGKTAASWTYEIERQNGSVAIVFKNTMSIKVFLLRSFYRMVMGLEQEAGSKGEIILILRSSLFLTKSPRLLGRR